MKNAGAILLIFLSLASTGFAQNAKSDSNRVFQNLPGSQLGDTLNKAATNDLRLPLLPLLPELAHFDHSDSTTSNPELENRAPFSVLFKFDTSPNNLEIKCYDFRKPITNNYTFLFNFLSTQQYTP